MTIRERGTRSAMLRACVLAAALGTIATAAFASGGRPTDPLMPMATTADIYIYVTMTAPVGPPPPLISIVPVAGAAPQALLSIVGSPSGLENQYWFYKGTTPFFEPAGGVTDSSTAAMILDQSVTTQLTWTDAASGIGRWVGGVGGVDYFYFCVAVDLPAGGAPRNLSPRSNRVGEMDQNLQRAGIARAINMVTVPLQGTGIAAHDSTSSIAEMFRFCLRVQDWNGVSQVPRNLYARTINTPLPAPLATHLGPATFHDIYAHMIHVYFLSGDTLGRGTGQSADSLLSIQGNVKEPDAVDNLYHHATSGASLNWVALHLRWQFDNSITTAAMWGQALETTGIWGGELIARWNALSQVPQTLGHDPTRDSHVTTWINNGPGTVTYGFPYRIDMGGVDAPGTIQLWPVAR